MSQIVIPVARAERACTTLEMADVALLTKACYRNDMYIVCGSFYEDWFIDSLWRSKKKALARVADLQAHEAKLRYPTYTFFIYGETDGEIIDFKCED